MAGLCGLAACLTLCRVPADCLLQVAISLGPESVQEAAGPGRKLLTLCILHGEEGRLLTCEMMEVGLVHEIGNEVCTVLHS